MHRTPLYSTLQIAPKTGGGVWSLHCQVPEHCNPKHSASSWKLKFVLGWEKNYCLILSNKRYRSTSLQYIYITLFLRFKAFWHVTTHTVVSEEAAPSCFYPEVGGCRYICSTGTYHKDNMVSHTRSWSDNEHCNKLRFHYIYMIQNRHIAVNILIFSWKFCVSDNINFSVLPESSALSCINSIHHSPRTAQRHHCIVSLEEALDSQMCILIQNQENVMHWAYSMHERNEKCIQSWSPWT
jgi:hypothetical protein